MGIDPERLLAERATELARQTAAAPSFVLRNAMIIHAPEDLLEEFGRALNAAGYDVLGPGLSVVVIDGARRWAANPLTVVAPKGVPGIWKTEPEIVKCVDALCTYFTNLLRHGAVIAAAVPASAPLGSAREILEGDDFRRLSIDLETDSFVSGNLRYEDIRIYDYRVDAIGDGARARSAAGTTATVERPASTTIVPSISAWLLSPTHNGESRKKVLNPMARREFPNMTVREFDQAYADAFGRSRGRPRKSAK